MPIAPVAAILLTSTRHFCPSCGWSVVETQGCIRLGWPCCPSCGTAGVKETAPSWLDRLSPCNDLKALYWRACQAASSPKHRDDSPDE